MMDILLALHTAVNMSYALFIPDPTSSATAACKLEVPSATSVLRAALMEEAAQARAQRQEKRKKGQAPAAPASKEEPETAPEAPQPEGNTTAAAAAMPPPPHKAAVPPTQSMFSQSSSVRQSQVFNPWGL